MNLDNKYCLLTNDVETTSIWHNSLRDDTGKKVLLEGMPILLDLYEKYNIKTTFFFTGYIAKLYPEIVKMILPYGHEVASHGMSHVRSDGFDIMSLNKQIKHLKESKDILENISGQEVISFRAPALRVNNNTAIALEKSGYLIDSSIASQRFDMFMSFGSFKKLNWLFCPRKPYQTSRKSLFKKGNGKIIEVPLSALILPYLGTTMRIFPKITSIQRSILNIESMITKKPIVFDIHPNEFIDESSEKREYERRVDNFLISFIQDNIRSKLKTKNLGLNGFKIYSNQVEYFIKKNYKFDTIKNYINNIRV